MKPILRVCVLALVALLGYASTSSSAIEEVVRLAPSDADAGFGEGFGTSVAISGDWIVVGAPLDDRTAPDAGAAYVFRRDGVRWIEHDKLMGLALEDAKFGHSVAIDGDRIVIGSPDFYFEPISAGTGRAYVFARDDRDTPDDLSDDWWDPVARLNPPPSHLCCSFGISVDVDGDTIVVGRRGVRPRVERAYVFRWDGLEWLPDATLVGSDTASGDGFGVYVGTSGGLVVVGAYRDDVNGARPGSAYLFRLDGETWVEEAKLVANDAADQDLFGNAVSIAHDCIAVGAKSDDDAGAGSGSVYAFRQDGTEWVQEQKLVPSDHHAYSRFGMSVETDGERIVVGAVGESWGYVFRHTVEGWTETQRLLGNERSQIHPIAIHGPYALVANYLYAVGENMSLPDYAEFQICFATGDPLSPGCERFDLEPDGRIDLGDYALFVQTWRGP